jgi:hypothetical protein
MRLAGWLMVVVALVVAGGGNATAANTDAEKQARRSFERAEAHFKAGAFAEALPEYEDGYARMPLPGFLINIAQCQRRLGDLVQARATYRKFILVAPDSPYVPEVKGLVAELDSLLDAQAPTSPPSPPSAAVPSPAEAATAVEPSSAASSNVLVAAPTATSVNPTPRSRWWIWGSVGGAVVVGAVVAVLLLRGPETTTIHDGSLGTLRN